VPDGWAKWGEIGAWSWDSSVGKTGSRSLSIANSRWNVGWAGPSFSADGSYSSVYPCYTLTGWVRADLTTGRTYLSVAWHGSGGWICNTDSKWTRNSTNGQWVKLSVMALPPVGATSGQVFVRSDKNEGQVWFDDISLTLEEFPVTGEKPSQDAPEGGQLAPYSCFVRDYPSQAGEAQLALAAYYTETGNHAAARFQLNSFASQFPNSDRVPEAKLFAAEIACMQDSPEAEDLLQSVADTYPDQAPAALMRIAYLHARRGGDKGLMQSDFLTAANRDPNALCAMECLYRAAKLDARAPADCTAALQRFQHVKQTSGDRRLQAEAMVDVGLMYLDRFFEDGESQDFLDAFSTLQSVKVDYPEQVNAIARAELRIGRYYLYTEDNPDAAREVLQNYLSTYPATAMTEVRYQLAYCSFAEKIYSDSVSRCLGILADKDVDWGWKAWCGFFMGHVYMKMKDYSSARKAFQDVTDKYPGTDFARIAKRALDLMPND
jgi:TolA-binding protein